MFFPKLTCQEKKKNHSLQKDSLSAYYDFKLILIRNQDTKTCGRAW